MHPMRKVSLSDVQVMRSDKQLRDNALRMQRYAKQLRQVAQVALQSVPSLKQHAARLGIHETTARRIAQGGRYKEVGHG